MDLSEFIGKKVKCLYNDFNQQKIAKGELVEYDGTLLKITGHLGTIVINKNNIVKMGEMK